MRFYLKFELEKSKLPLEIRRAIVSFIKKSLDDYNKKYESHYLEYFDFNTSKTRDYSFSLVFPLKEFSKEEILLKEPTNIEEKIQMKVVFSCSDRNNIGFHLINIFLLQIQEKYKDFPLENNSMTLKEIKIIQEKKIMRETALFETTIGGGIVVREHNKEKNKDIYYSVGDEEFLNKLNWIMKERFKRLGYPEEIYKNFNCEIISGRKTVVRHFNLKIPITIGIFKINAHKSLLEEVYKTGLGSRLSQGWGMLEYIGGVSNEI